MINEKNLAEISFGIIFIIMIKHEFCSINFRELPKVQSCLEEKLNETQRLVIAESLNLVIN
jgi:hypothetical protein